MKVFISFRYTGEAYESLVAFFSPLCKGLEATGFDVFCSLWKEQEYKERELSVKAMLLDALEELSDADVVLAVVRTNDRSEGMLMEIGYALAKQKPVVCVTGPHVQTFIDDLANSSAVFTSQTDLLSTSISLLSAL